MTKKTETTEDAVEVAKKEALIAVEMTKEQAEEFASFKAKKESDLKAETLAEKEKQESEELYEMVLHYRHNVNGKQYGPGPVQVPHYLIGHFQQYEKLSAENEIKLNKSKTNFFEVMSGGQVRKVTQLPG